MKKILAIILSITMLLSMGTVAFADGVNGPMQKAKLKVGISADFPPFEYYNENEELYGFDVDLMNYIGERIGFDIEFVNMSFDQLFSAVMGGGVACAISAISITEERNNVIDYTIPYLSAKVTHIDDETSDTSIEQYAIVFPNNSAEKGKLTEAAGEPETSLYNLVNNAISDLIEDKTIEKLGEKYELNKAADTEDFDYEYTVISVPDDFDKSNMDKSELSSGGQTSGTSVPYSDWAKSDIEKAIALNIINVGVNYNFPAPITREEFCELIYNYCYNVIKEIDTVAGENEFTDTTNSKIIRLNAMGIINGKSETEFAPNDLLTREEAAVILNRMVNKTIPVPVTEMYFNFDDEASISDWASDSIQVMCNMGVMNGVGENKFAPQDTYTTEQAIVTIVRVYAAQSANMGIIGGADAPTEIYIGEDIEVSDFYIEEAFKHTKKAGELAGTKEFISMYISDDETKTSIDNLSKTDFEKPVQMYYVSYNIDKVVEYYNKMIAEENPDEEIDVKKFIELNGFNLSVFATQINGRFGARTLAATTVLTSREGYIMPKDFENDFGIYLQYEGDYSALVTFNKIGEGVIEARMQFVRNGEKADMLMFMSEIYDALGEESITIGKIK